MHFLDAFLFAVTLSLTVPPVFCAPPDNVRLVPGIAHVVLCLLAAVILMRRGRVPHRERTPAARAVTMGSSLVTFGVLCVSSALMSVIAKSSPPPVVSSPKQIPLCVVTFVLSAFYEETVYRLYLPEALRHLLDCFGRCPRNESLRLPPTGCLRQTAYTQEGKAKLARGSASLMVAEAVPVLLFAFAHKYSGAPSIVNALAAAVALRLCLIRGRSLAACVGVHTAYNVLQLVLGVAVQ